MKLYNLHNTLIYFSIALCSLTKFADCKTFIKAPVGPYNLFFRRMEKCPDIGTNEMVMDLHLRKTNRTAATFFGDINFSYPFDRNIKMKVSVNSYGNGGWAPSELTTLDIGNDGCKTINDLLGKFWKKFWSAANHTLTDPCKIPAGHYEMKDLEVSNIHTSLPIMPYGMFRSSVFMYSPKMKLLGCLRCVTEITRKEY